jgi:hypothetical protein
MWREAGSLRWPPVSEGEKLGDKQSDSVPFRRFVPYMQPNWKGELWMRSLRKPGVLIQDPIYAEMGAGMKELHEEWRSCTPTISREVPFSGATASGRAALPSRHDVSSWVERPVATGKYALKHMEGKRYQFSNKPRFYEQERPEVPRAISARGHYTAMPMTAR